jgi:hypothetical protein
LAQTFVKLQAVQSILAGIEQVRLSLEKESLLYSKGKIVVTKAMTAAQIVYTAAVGSTTGAMKALRIAMLAVPIIAIIAGIVALIAALASFFSSTKEAEAQNNKLNESFDRQNKALEANSRAYKRNADNKRALMVAENATAEELFEFDKKRLAEEEALRKKNVKMLQTLLPQKTAAYKKALEEGDEELAKTIREETQQMREKYKGFRELDGQYAVDRKLLEAKRRNELKEENEQQQKEQEAKQKEWAKKAAERRAEEHQKQLDQQKLLEDLLALNIEDANLRKITQQKLQHDRELAEVRKKYGDQSAVALEMERKQATEKTALLEEIKKQEEADKTEKELKEKQEQDALAEKQRKDLKARLEGEIIEQRENFEVLMELKKELAEFERQEALLQKDLTEGEKFKIEQEYLEKIDALKEEQAEKDKERQKKVAEANMAVLKAGLDASQALSDAFFDYKIEKAEKGSAEELRMEKKKFEVNKKMQIAQAMMQGVQAVLAAYSSGSAIPVVGAVTGPLFAAAAAITTGLNIARIKATTFEGGAVSTPSVSAPNVNVPEASAPTTLTEGLPGSGSTPQTMKVVMVDSDLKASLQNSQSVDVTSSIG